MNTKQTILVTGAGGEMGHSLVRELVESGHLVVAVDLRVDSLQGVPGVELVQGSVTDTALLDRLFTQFNFDAVFHLAALLSTSGERAPERAFDVNVLGSFELIKRAQVLSEKRGSAVKFIFPSTIAVYGLQAGVKAQSGRVKESEHLTPITMYGVNKLSVEQLGTYFSEHYRYLDEVESGKQGAKIDFRAIRFPGILSADTVPSGGTSDYGPEMIHAAAQGKPYQCFVEPEAQLPFMVMPDAIRALVLLAEAGAKGLKQRVFNVGAFSITAAEFEKEVRQAFGTATVTFNPHKKRASIVASWPRDVDDTAAREQWGWAPNFDRRKAFDQYLIPAVTKRYRATDGGSGHTNGSSAGNQMSGGCSGKAKECAHV